MTAKQQEFVSAPPTEAQKKAFMRSRRRSNFITRSIALGFSYSAMYGAISLIKSTTSSEDQ
jgi:hypothetical protein